MRVHSCPDVLPISIVNWIGVPTGLVCFAICAVTWMSLSAHSSATAGDPLALGDADGDADGLGDAEAEGDATTGGVSAPPPGQNMTTMMIRATRIASPTNRRRRQ